MCRINPVTKDHIEQMRSSLQQRLANPNLREDQRAMLQAQLDYVLANIKERAGDPATSAVYFRRIKHVGEA